MRSAAPPGKAGAGTRAIASKPAACPRTASAISRPASVAVTRFFGGMNFLSGQRAGSVVETALGSFHLASATQPDGPVTLTIRPENIRLCHDSEAPAENTIAGTVTRRAYAGTYTRLKVEAAGRQFEVVADAAEGGRFGEGDPVCLHFPPERLWLLPG